MTNNFDFKFSPLGNKDRLRSRNISRWHTVDTSKRQSVAEHSFCMQIIAESLLDGLYKGTDYSPSSLEKYWSLKYAQIHDLDEIIVGDLSSVIKQLLKLLSVDFEKIMDKIQLQLIPEMIEVKDLFMNKPYFAMIMKAADLLEALDFFKYGKGLDTEHNELIERKILDGLKEIAKQGKQKFPQFNWDTIEETREDIFHGDSAILNFEKIDLVSKNTNLKEVS